MNEKNVDLYNFGEFYLDAREKILRRGAEVLPLPPKVSDVLCLLVEKHGKMISKNELMETVWADSFVEESNLTQSIYSLRRVLGKDADGKNFIETVPRRGYRFAAQVRHVEESQASSVSAVIEKEESPAKMIAVEVAERAAFERQVSKPGFGYGKFSAVGVALLIIILFGVFAAYFFSLKSATPAPSLENVSFQRLTFSGDVTFPIISPDGKSFAYVRQNSIYLQDINTGSSFKLNIPDHKIFGNLQFSVDNESIFFRNETSFEASGNLFQVSRFGGAVRKIAENVWSPPGFAPDGKRMAFMRFFPGAAEWALITKNLETGEERKLISRYAPFTLYRRGFPAWSFDGAKIATVEQTPNEKNVSRLIVVNAETGATETLDTPRFVQIEQAAWQPNDSGLVLAGREDNRFFQLWKISYPQAEVRKITNDLISTHTLSLSADGTKLLALQRKTYSHIWTATAAENLQNQKQITFGNLNRDSLSQGLSWTRDAQTLIYSSRITGNTDLWSVRVADGLRRQLTENAGATNESQALSPDEKYIYFASTRTGTRRIWRIDLNGENPTQMTFGEQKTEFCPAVSPGGDWLYFIQRGAKQNTIWRKSLIAGGEPEQVTEAGKFSPAAAFLAFSFDGKRLAFKNLLENGREQTDGKNMQIAVISIDESEETKFFNIAATVSKIYWTENGKAFDYVENTLEGAKLRRQKFDGDEEPKVILSVPNAEIFDFAWSADGKNLAVARGKNESDVMLFRNFE